MTVLELQERMQEAVQAIKEDDLTTVKSLVRTYNYSYQNLCGQTLLHWAVLKSSRDVITWLCKTFPKIINIPDNVRLIYFVPFDARGL